MSTHLRANLALKERARVARINPKEWLVSHTKIVHLVCERPAPEWLDAGGEAIAAHEGCVVSALTNTPDLQVEIVLAYLLEDAEIGEVARTRIFDLAKSMNHHDL